MNSNNCESCAVNNQSNLKKLGISLDNADFVIALAGNPNTGKSTVFNAVTGLRQHTGNWPGKTVTRAEGAFILNDKKFKIIDLPGTYSLLSTSVDEEVARDFILFGQPDVTIIVIDATRIERNLNLVLQVLEITNKAVLCLNLMDEAKQYGITVDIRSLSRDLGIPVIPAAARRNEGIKEVLQAVFDVATGKYVCKPHRLKGVPKEVSSALDIIESDLLKIYPNMPNSRWIALRLLEGDQRIIEAIKSGELGSLKQYELIDEAIRVGGTEDDGK